MTQNKSDEYYNELIRKYSDLNLNLSQERIEEFKQLGPLTKDLMITLYGSFEEYLNRQRDKHPLEEYIISFDEFMFDSEMVDTIAMRMGMMITDKIEAYKTFIDRIVQVIKLSNYTIEDYRRIINMRRSEYDKLNLDFEFDDRLFVFFNLKN
jgi:hypothetical protein